MKLTKVDTVTVNGIKLNDWELQALINYQEDSDKFKIITTKSNSTDRVREEIKENENNKEIIEQVKKLIDEYAVTDGEIPIEKLQKLMEKKA